MLPYSSKTENYCRSCHKIFGTPMKMGTQMGKWGPPTVWVPRVSRNATSRPVSSVPVYEVYKWNNQVVICQSESRMENDNQAKQGRFRFNDIHHYLHDSRYPDGYTKSEKLALRKRAKFFCARGADLFYVGGASSTLTVIYFRTYFL